MKIKTFFDAMLQLSGTNERKDLFKTFFSDCYKNDDKNTLTLLKLYLNDQIPFNLAEKSVSGIIGKFKVPMVDDIAKDFGVESNGQTTSNEVANEVKFINFLNKISSRAISGNDALKEFELLYDGLDDEGKSTLVMVILRKPIGVGLRMANEVHEELYQEPFVEIFQCQLANKFVKGKKRKKTDAKLWIATPKFDGIRSVWRDKIMYSRGNLPQEGFDDINQLLNELGVMFGVKLFDGEIFTNKVSFQKISGIVSCSSDNKSFDSKKLLDFNCFACIKDGENFKTSEEMYKFLDTIKAYCLSNQKFERIKFVDWQIVQNEDEVMLAYAREMVDLGYEGGMFRNNDIPYEYKRGNGLFKLKFMIEETFPIIDIEEGEGKCKGMAGAIVVEGDFEGKHVVSNVGTGFEDETRIELWNNKNYYIGKKAEIHFQGLSQEKENIGTNNWSLRFPAFKGVRHDL